MWFAAWWIHIERLPWQLGADFFFRHLLDGDPASNTLSWKWVAGIQTPGKTYLPRRSNLEKYLDPDRLAAHSEGLAKLEKPEVAKIELEPKPEITKPKLPATEPLPTGDVGLWIHEEDLCPELGPLSCLKIKSILVTENKLGWEKYRFSKQKRDWLLAALDDAQKRATKHFLVPLSRTDLTAQKMLEWAEANQLSGIAVMRPEVGLIDDRLHEVEKSLKQVNISLHLMDREEDLKLRPLATSGFFGFWKKMQNLLL
jgi:deoxyribodipyrimidine photo-lyase